MLKTELTNTNAGLMAIQRAIAGENIIFTKLKIGDGILTNPDISNLENIIKEIKTFPLGVVKPESGEMLRVRANINNVGLTSDELIREYGLFAKFANESEFLFAYLNVGEDTTPLPAASSGRYDLNRDFVLNIGNNMNVTFDANGDLVYATLNDIKALDAKKEDAFSKKSGFNLDKTDEVENDSNKLFSAKGALNLKNWLVSNYTTLMNNIRESLTTLVNTKLPHGGYGGSGQDLKNLADSKVSKNGDTTTGKMLFDCLPSLSGQIPSVSVAIGDSDTGFNSKGDGNIALVSNGIEIGETIPGQGVFNFVKDRVKINGNSIWDYGNFDPNKKADKLVAGTSGDEVTWIKICDMVGIPGADPSFLTCMVNGGTNYGVPNMPMISLVLSCRGATVSDRLPNSLVSAVNLLGKNQENLSIIAVVEDATKTSFWLERGSGYSYPVSFFNMDSYNTTMGNGTSTTVDPTTGKQFKKFGISKSYTSENTMIFKPTASELVIKFPNGLMIQTLTRESSGGAPHVDTFTYPVAFKEGTRPKVYTDPNAYAYRSLVGCEGRTNTYFSTVSNGVFQFDALVIGEW